MRGKACLIYRNGELVSTTTARALSRNAQVHEVACLAARSNHMVQSTLVTVVIDWLLQSIINFIHLVVKKIKEGRGGGGGGGALLSSSEGRGRGLNRWITVFYNHGQGLHIEINCYTGTILTFYLFQFNERTFWLSLTSYGSNIINHIFITVYLFRFVNFWQGHSNSAWRQLLRARNSPSSHEI